MQRVPPATLKIEASPVLRAQLAEDRFRKLFPVRFDDVDTWAAAEPTKAALVRLEKGDLFVVTYGMSTHTLEISLPKVNDVQSVVSRILEEAPIEPATIQWRSPGPGPSKAAAKIRRVASSSRPRKTAATAAKKVLTPKRRSLAKRHKAG